MQLRKVCCLDYLSVKVLSHFPSLISLMVSVDAKHRFTYFRMARDKSAVSLLESEKERYIKATINNRTAVTTLETIVAGIAPRPGDSRDSVYEVHSVTVMYLPQKHCRLIQLQTKGGFGY